MKRLTIYRDGALEINCENCPETKICKRAELTESDCLYFLTERLAKYEDMEEQGLLVRLPCKVGDTVYWLNYNRSACKTCDLFSSFYGVDCMCGKHYELYPEINSVYDDKHCPKHFIEIVKWKTDLGWIVEHLNDFGKTIFLTREEAEKALEDV